MASQVGSAFIPVKPDMRGFHKTIAAEFKTMSAEAEKWGRDTGKRFAQGFQTELRTAFAKLPHAKIKAEADTKTASEELDRAAHDRTAKIKVKTDTSGLGGGAGGGGAGGGLRGLLIGAGAVGGLAFGPQIAGLAAGLVGVAGNFAAAGVAGAAFGAIAVPMFKKVTAAQKAYTTARKQYDLATTKAGRAAALKREQLAMKGLTPAERDLAKQLNVLKGAWSDLNKAQQPVVAASLRPWFAVARQGFSFLPSLIRPAADAVSNLGTDAKHALAAPWWKSFFRTVGTTGGIALNGFGHAVGYVADGLAHLFKDFAPEMQQLPGLIDGWAQSFDHWAKHYNKSGFDNFIKKTFSPANVANLKSSAKAAGTLLANVAKASGNISPAGMLGLNKVLIALSKLSPGQIEALGLLYTASRFTPGGGLGKLGKVLTGAAAGGAAGKAAGSVGGGRAFLGSLGAEAGLGALGGREAGFGAGNLLGRQGFNKILGSQQTKAAKSRASIPGANLPPFSWIASFSSWAAGPPVAAATLGWQKISKGVSKAAKGLWGSSASEAKTAGKAVAHAFGTAWNASSGWVSKQFGKATSWAKRSISDQALVKDGRALARGLGSGYSSVSGWVSKQFGKAKGWVTGAVSGAGHWLVSAGSAVMSGFLSGIKTGWSKVTGFVSGIGSWIAAHKGPVSKDRLLLIPHGKAIMAGLYAGLKQGFPSVSKFITKATSLINGAAKAGLIGKGTQSQLTRWLAADNKRLKGLAADRSKIARTIAAAQSYAKTTKGNLKSGFDLANMPVTGAPMSISDITGFVAGNASALKTFARNITKLKRAGVADALIRQVTALGPDQGNQVAATILAGSKSDIRALNKAEQRATRFAGLAGNNAADALYDAGKNASKGFLTGLKSQERAITKEMTRIARNMIKTLKRELKISSPSKVTHQVGVWAGAGVHRGLATQVAPTRLAAARLARAAIPMPWQVANGMSGGAAAPVNVHVLLDGQAIEPRMVKVVSEHDRGTVRAARAGTGQVR